MDVISDSSADDVAVGGNYLPGDIPENYRSIGSKVRPVSGHLLHSKQRIISAPPLCHLLSTLRRVLADNIHLRLVAGGQIALSEGPRPGRIPSTKPILLRFRMERTPPKNGLRKL